ncbi:hypothetical protein SDC49_24560 [Lactobacillus sp. R2/2]|nr:hypothetical protein [Lactobacillus sp. R2/2]
MASRISQLLTKETQIKNEQQQLITLDPNLGKIAALTQEQVIKLQEDFQNYRQKKQLLIKIKVISLSNFFC